MSDCDVTQMEELMAREPQLVACLDCEWNGGEHQLINNNCPKCNSHAIEYDIPDNIYKNE